MIKGVALSKEERGVGGGGGGGVGRVAVHSLKERSGMQCDKCTETISRVQS